jgi:DNA-binding HxlR family transcriptional regulator
LRNSEWTTLREVGTFRVVAESDLARDVSDPNVLRNDVRHLAEEGLLERKTAIVNQQPTSLLVLTDDGKSLLENATRSAGEERPQSITRASSSRASSRTTSRSIERSRPSGNVSRPTVATSFACRSTTN